ncbi:MAG: hypothetical protein WCQ21_38365, partial [Verrucomicrobiota bacterium]
QPQAFTLLPWVVQGNGLLSGQYNAPIFEYLFPEQILGNPIPPINPEGFGFLAQGSGPLNGPGTVVSASNPLVGQLTPWPGAVAPAAAIIPPTAKVASASVTLQGGNNATVNASPSTGSTPMTFAWRQIAGPTTGIKINTPTQASTTIGTPSVSVITTLTFQVTVSNSAGFSTANVTVTLNPPNTVFAVATVSPSPVNETAASPTPTVTLTGSSAGSNLRFAWTQLAGGPRVTINSANTSRATVTAPRLAVGDAPVTLTFQLAVTGTTFNSTTVTSTATVSVVINPPPDVVTITGVVYRSAQQRLTVTATSSFAGATLTLSPFTVQGVTFGAETLFLVNGALTASVVGVALPTTTQTFTVTSSAGGSASSVVTLFR